MLVINIIIITMIVVECGRNSWHVRSGRCRRRWVVEHVRNGYSKFSRAKERDSKRTYRFSSVIAQSKCYTRIFLRFVVFVVPMSGCLSILRRPQKLQMHVAATALASSYRKQTKKIIQISLYICVCVSTGHVDRMKDIELHCDMKQCFGWKNMCKFYAQAIFCGWRWKPKIDTKRNSENTQYVQHQTKQQDAMRALLVLNRMDHIIMKFDQKNNKRKSAPNPAWYIIIILKYKRPNK